MAIKQSRVILHVDMNSFFASVEQAANPPLRGKPIAVGGGIKKGSVVAAASYEAKARGVKTGMSTWEARKLCPELIVVIGDMAKYIHTSKVMTRMLIDYTDLVEVFSIDEAFMDITLTHERFGGPIELAKEIKRRIWETFRLTCNIGIGPNKLVAKLAGELKKPDGLIVLNAEDIPGKIENVAASELCGVGRKMEKYLAELGVKTIGQLHRYPREKLVRRFGQAYGEQLWQMGQGHGSDIVRPYYHETAAKSMEHSYTLPKATDDIEEVKSYLLRLCEQVGRRLRKDNYRGNIIHVSLGYGNYQFWGKQRKLDDYLDDGYRIFKIAADLLTTHYSQPDSQPDSQLITHPHIRFVSISISGLLHNLDQVCLFEADEGKKKVLKAMDDINNRFGEFTVERASIMRTVLHGKAGMVAPKLYGLR